MDEHEQQVHDHPHHEGEHPHDPAPPGRARLLAPWPLLSRGLALALLALALFVAAARLLRASPVLLALPGLILVFGGFLAAWAAAIHVTGGEKFDDHPFI